MSDDDLTLTDEQKAEFAAVEQELAYAGIPLKPEDDPANPPPPDTQKKSRRKRDTSINDATELAAARAMREQLGNEFRFNVDSGDFYHYVGIWRRDKDGAAVRAAKGVARRSAERMRESGVDGKTGDRMAQRLQSAAGIAGILKLFSTEDGIPASSDDFDADDFLLAAENCTIDLRTGKDRPHRAADLITKQIPVVYDAQADCPLWRSFLERIMDGRDELIAYLQRLAGLCLTGASVVQELFILHGSGANGKSVFIDTIMGMLGEYAGTAPESLLMVRGSGHGEHPTEIADVWGKRLVVASETDSRGELRLQMVKRLTGDMMLKARFMRQDYFEFRRTHKLILVTNNRPKIPESTEAAWRRIRLIPFDVTIPPEERDPYLLQKLRAEWPGILAWAVRGCLEWQRDGMNPPAEVLAATEDYKAEADPIGEYVSERLIVGEFARVSRADVFADYTAWAGRQHIAERDRLDRSALFDRLRRVDGVADSEWKIDGSKVRGFTGIGVCASKIGVEQ